MALKIGTIVSHTAGLGWGSGKVVEINDRSATIQFSDGTHRKIAATHYATLQPADPTSFTQPLPIETAPVKAPRVPRKKK